MSRSTELLQHLYDRFNHRDVEAVLAALHPDVRWANGMEGGHVHGHEGVRNYWTRQWAVIDPHVEPLAFTEPGEVEVEVHQTVRDLQGTTLADIRVHHVFRFEDGLVRWFDLRED